MLDCKGVLAEELNEHLVLHLLFRRAHLDDHVLLPLCSGAQRARVIRVAFAPLTRIRAVDHSVIQAIFAEEVFVVGFE